MGDAKQSAQPDAANGTAEVQDLNAEPDQSTQALEDVSDAPTGSVDPWPDEKPGISPEEEEMLLKAFFQEVREVDRDNEVNRILGAFKLNPFEQMGLRFDSTQEEVKRQYRKVSLLIHPDKCKHPLATSAFEVLGHANSELANEDFMREFRHTLNLARDEVRKERKKKTKHDAVVRLASVIHEGGREGVEAEWESTEEFHELWKMKSRDMLARAEWRRRKLTKRLKEEEERIEESEAETRKKMKATKEHTKKWEETRENRVGTWRDFVQKKGKSKKGTNMLGGIKPPKLKVEDEEHTYIQRPVQEQWRPAQPKPAGPQGKPPNKPPTKRR
ncbi:g1256 [Coccomyxa elongata]